MSRHVRLQHICSFPNSKPKDPIHLARPLAGFNSAHKTHGVHRVAAEIPKFVGQPKAPPIGEKRPVQAGQAGTRFAAFDKVTVDPSRFSFRARPTASSVAPQIAGSGLEGWS